jgi:hypothetical protein
MARQTWAVALAVCASGAALAAPVPPPRLVTAEAVLKPPKGGSGDLAAKLTSRPLLNSVLRSKAAASLGCLRWENDPHAWLASRLKAGVDSGRGTVAIRLADCPRKDAVALLTAVVEAYKADLLQGGLSAAQEKEMRLVRLIIAQQVNGQAGVNGAFQLVGSTLEAAEGGLSKAEVDASVLQTPRIVQAGPPSPSR